MLNRRQFVLSSAAGAAFAATSARALATSPHVPYNVRRYLAPLVARNDYSGFLIMERAGRTLIAEGFGYADDDARTPHTEHTHYASASTGKMFTHAAIIELEKAGRLSRGDTLAKYFPDMPAWAPVTISHLIEHKSGLARDFPPDTDLQKPRTTSEVVAIVAGMPVEAKPGEVYAYSNNGYRLLARIIEIAGGGEFDPLARELVFEPRKMTETIPNIPPVSAPRLTRGYRPGPGWRSKVPASAFNMSNWRGAGSFLITPADMLRFAKTLPIEQSELAEAARTTPDGKPKQRSVGHDGFGDGYANLVYAYPDEQGYLVSLTNMQSGSFMPMHGDMRRLLFGEQVDAPALPAVTGIMPAASDYAHFVGDYDLRPGNPVRIRQKDELLTVDGGDGAHPLVPLGQNRFFMRLRYATMRFEGEAGKPASLLRWAEGGGEFPLKRLA